MKSRRVSLVFCLGLVGVLSGIAVGPLAAQTDEEIQNALNAAYSASFATSCG